jgi:hypothetical protein
MTTNVEIIASEKLNVLTIPMQAFTRKKVEQPADAGSDAPASAPAPAEASASDAGNGGGRRGGRGAGAGRPQWGTVIVVKPDGSQETRDVQVGMSDRVSYEVLSDNLKEGDTLLLNKQTDSKWRNNGGRGGASQMMRGLGGR